MFEDRAREHFARSSGQARGALTRYALALRCRARLSAVADAAELQYSSAASRSRAASVHGPVRRQRRSLKSTLRCGRGYNDRRASRGGLPEPATTARNTAGPARRNRTSPVRRCGRHPSPWSRRPSSLNHRRESPAGAFPHCSPQRRALQEALRKPDGEEDEARYGERSGVRMSGLPTDQKTNACSWG